jgi:hypothetical protein
MAIELPFFDPNAMEFLRWARLLVELLAEYNVSNPVSEDLWQEWAVQFVTIPEITALGVTDPQTYGNWRVWANSFVQVLS